MTTSIVVTRMELIQAIREARQEAPKDKDVDCHIADRLLEEGLVDLRKARWPWVTDSDVED